MSSDKRCTALNAAGVQCGAPRRTGRPFCLAHDPDARAEHRAQSRKGGVNSRPHGGTVAELLDAGALNVATLASDPSALARYLAACLLQLAALPMSPKLGHAVASVAGAFRGLYEDVILAGQVADLERSERTAPPSSRPPLAIWRDDRPM